MESRDRSGIVWKIQGFLLKTLWGHAVVGLIVLGAIGLAIAQPAALPRREITLTALSVPLSTADANVDRTGLLRFMGGLWLTSEDKGFGGLSGLIAEKATDGFLVTAISDQGDKFTGHLTLEGVRLKGMNKATLEPLADLNGKAITGKAWGDSESIARLSDGRVLVGFERNHRIWSYDAGLTGTARVFETPEALKKAPSNGGLESIATWPDGRVLAITEQMRSADGNLVAFLLQNETWSTLEWKPSAEGFEPSDATVLANGDLLILERSWSVFAPTKLSSRVMRVRAATIKPGAVLQGEAIGELTPPLIADNFEGITSFINADGKTQILLISDDNFNGIQRTLLLSFEIEEGPGPAPTSK
ncbi:MAG: esterase-like activity of phytase family protein [Vicinamibacteria bacterium]